MCHVKQANAGADGFGPVGSTVGIWDTYIVYAQIDSQPLESQQFDPVVEISLWK